MLHELGHIVLGHLDGYSVGDGSGNTLQLINYDNEDQADTFAREYVKPRDPENAISAMCNNSFCDKIFKEISNINSLSYELFRKTFDAGLNYDIRRRFKGEKFNAEAYSHAMIEAAAAM